MRKNFFVTSVKSLCVLCGLFFLSCNNTPTETAEIPQKKTHTELVSSVDSLENILRSQSQINYQLGAAMIKAYVDVVNDDPKGEKSAEYLFKAGDVCMNLKQSKKAIEFFTKVHDEHIKSDKAQMALFLQAFIYETQLNDLEKSRMIYGQVMSEYPGTKLAGDAKASIDNLGKTDDELIKEFEKKNEKK